MSDPPEQRVYEAHVGWTKNGNAYVTADNVIGQMPNNIVGVNRSNSIDDLSGKLSTSGDWNSWRDNVGELARLSSIMMLAICISFAAPLLYVLKRRSFMICISGKTRTGKTVATLMGSSIPGIGQVDQLITWRLTDARLEQRIAEYNDAVFPIDDLETMSEKGAKEKYLRIRNIAYNLEQGWAMGRHNSFAITHGGAHEHWRCIAITSNEKSIRDLAQSAKLNRQPGETLRLIDVPAVLSGLDHIFDRSPSNSEISDFQDWKAETFSKIAHACEQNHGATFQKYISKLIAHRNGLKQYLHAGINYFVKQVRDECDGDIARDVAEKFGLIFVGGMLGKRYGLVPWKKSELLDAVTKCYLAARELLPDDGVALRHGIQALKERLRELPSLSDQPTSKTAKWHYENVDGYRKGESSMYRCIIKCDAFNSIFASTYERNLVLNWLIRKGQIALAVSKTATPGSEPRLKKQHEWPDGERRRSYEICWPRKSKTDDITK
jgi:uncharacterized protein (DUF927 family)